MGGFMSFLLVFQNFDLQSHLGQEFLIFSLCVYLPLYIGIAAFSSAHPIPPTLLVQKYILYLSFCGILSQRDIGFLSNSVSKPARSLADCHAYVIPSLYVHNSFKYHLRQQTAAIFFFNSPFKSKEVLFHFLVSSSKPASSPQLHVGQVYFPLNLRSKLHIQPNQASSFNTAHHLLFCFMSVPQRYILFVNKATSLSLSPVIFYHHFCVFLERREDSKYEFKIPSSYEFPFHTFLMTLEQFIVRMNCNY